MSGRYIILGLIGVILSFFVSPKTSLAQSNSAEAIVIFKKAEMLHKKNYLTKNTELANALNELGQNILVGRRFLLNKEEEKAAIVAEQVLAQMEWVKALLRVVKMKAQLEQIKSETNELIEKKRQLDKTYNRLLLLKNGRALTNAYPRFKQR